MTSSPTRSAVRAIVSFIRARVCQNGCESTTYQVDSAADAAMTEMNAPKVRLGTLVPFCLRTSRARRNTAASSVMSPPTCANCQLLNPPP